MAGRKPNLLLVGGATDRMRAQLAEIFTVFEDAHLDDMQTFLIERGPEIEAICVYGGVSLVPGALEAMPNLKIISGYGVGYDGIPASEAAECGVMVTHTPNVLNEDVANLGLLLLLAVSRRLVRDDAWARSGDWAAKGSAPLTRSIEGSTVGILGFGRIGEALARKLEVFGITIVYHQRNEKAGSGYRYYDDLVAMAADVDTLVSIVPGGAATRRIVNREVMEALGPDGTFINIGRGTVVDEPEMVAALQDGRLGAAGLDVFEDEPHVPMGLRNLENVVLMPHMGSATVETRRAMGDLTVENLRLFFADGSVVTPVPECQHLQKS
ncbi:MAG: 2-hydroxyacid dehydrogenase [Pseudomonadota bacterium]